MLYRAQWADVLAYLYLCAIPVVFCRSAASPITLGLGSQVERIKATEPNVVAPIGTGALEERAQAGRKALEVRADATVMYPAQKPGT